MHARRHPSVRPLEVSVLWGPTLLDVQTVAPGAPVRVGTHTLAVEGPGRFDLGPLQLEVRGATAASPLPRERIDLRFFEILGLVLAAHAALIAALWMQPADVDASAGAGAGADDLFHRPEVMHAIVVRPRLPQKFPAAGALERTRAPATEGARGRPEAKPARTVPAKQNGRMSQRERLLHTGLLAGLGAVAASDVLGSSGLDGAHGGSGLGATISSALEGLRGGTAMKDAHGLGVHGSGPGGGGAVEGIGGLGTHGEGASGSGLLDIGGPGKTPTRVRPGPMIVCGALPKDVVGAIVRKHWHEIRYCYETGLSRHPTLYGKVAVAFTIDGTGAVPEATVRESTLGDPEVERCVTERVRRWRFPEPKGGGQVYVTYPWVFRAAAVE